MILKFKYGLFLSPILRQGQDEGNGEGEYSKPTHTPLYLILSLTKDGGHTSANILQ